MKDERQTTVLLFSNLLRTTGYSPPPEGWPFVGDEGSGWFFGRDSRAKLRVHG